MNSNSDNILLLNFIYLIFIFILVNQIISSKSNKKFLSLKYNSNVIYFPVKSYSNIYI